MAIPNGVKVGVLAAALVAAGFLFWKNSKSTDANSFLLNEAQQFFTCSQGHDFVLTAAESRANAQQNSGIILCPQCSSASSEAHPCPACKKLMPLVGHGNIPDVCPFCKAKVNPQAPAPK
ncbi:MAG: hypothetical protein AMXMBFR58_05450 [Phycisphaerae bacterium]|nr:hypothetical protein [Phycisphaerales bacterium]MCK6478227.1 hypothetical protein [Phycisphaerales bacterium]